MSNNKIEKQRKQLNSYARYSGIAIQMMAIIGIGTFAGVKLDELYPNNYNIYTIVLSLAFVLISIYIVIKRILSASKDDN
ncbi:AtpZ/AtpI family protein [Aureibaculum marinum]|uniref:AtpZ/AtpI family protein n=1 Tax=Aureibaculum marinum TaxID=2487930 RepID=A0A3N4NJH9_9FLAO|nr:AtpZ/AtpI family protein [Aureibaculum marinum]RPD93416.1 AtpZ/AtpI family protein [Aureibaculum marinum]